MSKKIIFFFLLAFVIASSDVFAQSTRKAGTTAKPKSSSSKATKKTNADSTAVAPKAPPAEAVDDKPLRVELEAKSPSENYITIPAGQSGLVMAYMSSEKSAKGSKFKDWIITKYDNQFNEQFSKTFTFDKEVTLEQTYVDEDTKHMYALFATNENIVQLPKANGITGKFEVYDLDLTANTVNIISGELARKMHINVFKSIGDDLYMGGSNVATIKMIRKASCTALLTCFIGGQKHFDITPYMVKINTTGHKVEEVNFNLAKQGEILSIDKDTIAKKTFAAVIDAPMPLDRNIAIYEINSTRATKVVKLSSQSDYILLDGKLVCLNEQEKVVMGSYIKIDPKDKAKVPYGLEAKMNKNMPTSTGFYIAKFTGSKQDYVKFAPFTKFKDMQDIVTKEGKGKAKKEAKIEKEINSYNLLVHEIIQRGDELVVLGDAYYPHYHIEYTTTRTTTNGMTTTQTESHRVFDGWMFTHSLVAGFDKSGEMKWNAAFKLPEVLTWRLKPQVKILPNSTSGNIVMLYNYGGTIKSKILNGETLEAGVDYASIDTGSEKDKIKSSSYSNIEYWYGHYFIAYGFEKIKNSDSKIKKRNVFYLNKVAYR